MAPKNNKRVAPEPAKATAGNGSWASRLSTNPTSPKNAGNRVEKTRTSSTGAKKSTNVIADKLSELQSALAPAQSAVSGLDAAVRCPVCGGVPDTKHVGQGYKRLTDQNKNQFHPGDIIIVQHNTNYNDEVSKEDSKDYYHVGNGIVHSKFRPMVVLVTHDRHLLAVPIRSHAGKGTRKFKGDEVWYKNFFPVIQAGTTYKKKENEQTPLETSHALDANSCLDITEAVTVHYKEWFEHSRDRNRLTSESSSRLLLKWGQRFTSAARGQDAGFKEEQKQELIDEEGYSITGRNGKPT